MLLLLFLPMFLSLFLVQLLFLLLLHLLALLLLLLWFLLLLPLLISYFIPSIPPAPTLPQVLVEPPSNASKVVCSGEGLRAGTMGKEIKCVVDTRSGPGSASGQEEGHTSLALVFGDVSSM